MWPNCSEICYEKIFGNNVKACREAKGLTKKELAEDILGYPEELLQKIEDGVAYNCCIRFCIDLAKYFNVSLDSLLTCRHFTIPNYKNI